MNRRRLLGFLFGAVPAAALAAVNSIRGDDGITTFGGGIRAGGGGHIKAASAQDDGWVYLQHDESLVQRVQIVRTVKWSQPYEPIWIDERA